MVQPLFVSTLHCTPDGIGIFVGLLRPKNKGKKKRKKKKKKQGLIRIDIPENEDSISR